MYKRILIALDLEGVNKVVGEPYKGLEEGSDQWFVAREQAAKEVNAAANALFEAGAECVALWDNHGSGKNIDQSSLDKRIELLSPGHSMPRMSFAKERFDCICYFGYHTMEGTLGGVLAHTMSSKVVQYYKLNGSYIGEIDMDACIAAEMGMPSVFFAGGDLTCRQAERAVPHLVTVETKKELERNKAVFRDNGELLSEIGREIVRAVSTEAPINRLSFPATLEKSFKRVEDAAVYLTRSLDRGLNSRYLEDEILGKDGHTVVSVVNNIDEFMKAI